MERKLATVLFVDLVDSTGLVASADPEVVRRRVTRYFAEVSNCIERHGGTVEKFAGDAVMAAFGVPRAHEDDADRAVRSAFAVLDAVHRLELEARIGVESGEVVVEDADSTFATGEAVNLAARLQQAAGPGEIRVGPGARRLAAGSVEVEDAGPVDVRGRAQPLWTWRALRVLDMRRRSVEAPFVGREAELELLQNSFARAVRDRRAHLVTVYGEPGLGKTRLVTEFCESVERATVLRGRTLPYGEGVTYWALASMIKASAGITDDDPANDAFEKLRVSCESEAVADLLAVALGVLGAAEGERSPEQLTWAALRWAEQLADAQPLVLVFEDVHWAEEPLLNLIEHLARSLRNAPVLLIAVARPDLLDTRPGWGGGIPRAGAIELTPLDGREADELAGALLGTEVPPAQRALVLERAEGNPLFLEEIARMLADGAVAERIPDSVQALIAARIDALDADIKHALQCAAVVGRVFWRGALERLCPDKDVAALIDVLLEREFVVPEERSTISGDRAFRFKHGLIRDVAYASVSKAQRAADHRTFAAWIAERAPDELAEIRAHHLDQAACLLDELDGSIADDLRAEAASAIDTAGRRALRRGAFVTARRSLSRATELQPTLERRYLAAHAASRLGNVESLQAEIEAVTADARRTGDLGVLGRSLVLLAEIKLRNDGDVAAARELADEALLTLPRDELLGLYDAHQLLATIAWWVGDAEASGRHATAMLDVARQTGRAELESLALTQLASIAGVRGEREHSLELLEQAMTLAESSGSREAAAFALAIRGRRSTELGDLDAAEADLRAALDVFAETGAAGRYGWTLSNLASVYVHRGDLALAERTLRDAVRRLRGTQEQGFLAEAERQLAEVLVRRAKIDEAEALVAEAQARVGREDAWTRASLLHALGLVRAAQGRIDEAEDAFRRALAIVEPTMYVILTTQVRASLDELAAQRRGELAGFAD